MVAECFGNSMLSFLREAEERGSESEQNGETKDGKNKSNREEVREHQVARRERRKMFPSPLTAAGDETKPSQTR